MKPPYPKAPNVPAPKKYISPWENRKTYMMWCITKGTTYILFQIYIHCNILIKDV